jgi:hypothetical protein
VITKDSTGCTLWTPIVRWRNEAKGGSLGCRRQQSDCALSVDLRIESRQPRVVHISDRDYQYSSRSGSKHADCRDSAAPCTVCFRSVQCAPQDFSYSRKSVSLDISHHCAGTLKRGEVEATAAVCGEF